MEGSRNQPSTGWASWIAFAGLMMMLIGVFDIIAGLAAVFSDTNIWFKGGEVVVFDFTAWGIIAIIFGLLLIGTGWGIINGSGWARGVAIVLVFLNAAAHVVNFPAHELWSFLVIVIDVFILFALTARWHNAQEAL
jgi:hypothetical protein